MLTKRYINVRGSTSTQMEFPGTNFYKKIVILDLD